MLRYVMVAGQKFILHAFVNDKALVESPLTGQVRIFPAVEVVFDPPTEEFVREQAAVAMRAQAVQGRNVLRG